jgi:hypothetical protein
MIELFNALFHHHEQEAQVIYLGAVTAKKFEAT